VLEFPADSLGILVAAPGEKIFGRPKEGKKTFWLQKNEGQTSRVGLNVKLKQGEKIAGESGAKTGGGEGARTVYIARK